MGATGGIFQVTGNIILIFFEIIKKKCLDMKYVWASNVLRGLNLLLINAFVLNLHYYSIRLRMIGAKWIFSRKYLA